MEERINHLIQRYLDRNESDGEFNELMELIASGRYRNLIESKFSKDLSQKISSTPFSQRHYSAIDDTITVRPAIGRKEITRTRFFGTRIFKVAVATSMIIAFVFGGLYIRQFGEATKDDSDVLTTVSTSSNVKKIILSDGSIVWLKGESMLSYPGKFGRINREVSLRGEALFEVAKDSLRPFIIDCGDLTTKVLGTSFNIKSDSKNTEILVLTGKVSVTPRGNSNTVFLNPKEKITYNLQTRILTKASSDKLEVTASMTNTEYSMSFNDISMKEVARRIEGKFSVEVRFSDDLVSRCFVTADFTDQSLKATMSMLSKLLDFQYEIDGTHINITGTGCEQRTMY